MRRIFVILAVLAVFSGVMALPASADPPESSGNVERFEADDVWDLYVDLDNEYWVFTNIERQTFCDWIFAGAPDEEFPVGIAPASLQLVFSGDSAVLRIEVPESQTWLHAFTGDDPLIDPCNGSEEAASFTGTLHWRINDNDGPNQGKRANSFGPNAQGTLWDAGGGAWHYSFSVRIVIPPDENFDDDFMFDESWIKAEKFNLHPIGKKS